MIGDLTEVHGTRFKLEIKSYCHYFEFDKVTKKCRGCCHIPKVC